MKFSLKKDSIIFQVTNINSKFYTNCNTAAILTRPVLDRFQDSSKTGSGINFFATFLAAFCATFFAAFFVVFFAVFLQPLF